MIVNSTLNNIEPLVYSALAKMNPVPLVSSVALNAIKGYILYSLFEAAASDTLCLKTVRHGTDPRAALRISIEGPNLERAGKGGESLALTLMQGRRRALQKELTQYKGFYVVEDYLQRPGLTLSDHIENYIASRGTLKYFSCMASAGFIVKALPLSKSQKRVLAKRIVALIRSYYACVFCTFLPSPTLKFHLDPQKVVILPPDSKATFPGKIVFLRDGKNALMGGCLQGALKTRHRFSPLDLGFCGIVKNGLNPDLPRRIKAHPKQFMWGIAQLIVALAFASLLYPQPTMDESVSKAYWDSHKVYLVTHLLIAIPQLAVMGWALTQT